MRHSQNNSWDVQVDDLWCFHVFSSLAAPLRISFLWWLLFITYVGFTVFAASCRCKICIIRPAWKHLFFEGSWTMLNLRLSPRASNFSCRFWMWWQVRMGRAMFWHFVALCYFAAVGGHCDVPSVPCTIRKEGRGTSSAVYAHHIYGCGSWPWFFPPGEWTE